LPAKGNPIIKTRVDPSLKVGLEAYALARGITLSQLVRQILMKFAHEVGHTHDGVCERYAPVVFPPMDILYVCEGLSG